MPGQQTGHAANVNLAASNTRPWWDYPVGHGYITTYQGPHTDTPHWADDVETPFHTPITALQSGTVKTANYQQWGGQLFIQPDEGGPQYYYYHLDEIDVSNGQHVNAGQMVGLSGGQNSGGMHNVRCDSQVCYSDGPHTHVGYFQKYVSTPMGTEPYGPDITPLLKSGGGGNFLPPGSGSIDPFSNPFGPATPQTPPSSSCAGIQLPGWLGGACLGATVPNVNPTDIAYRLLFGFLGLFMIYMGIKHFTGGQTINIQQQAPTPQKTESPTVAGGPPPPTAKPAPQKAKGYA